MTELTDRYIVKLFKLSSKQAKAMSIIGGIIVIFLLFLVFFGEILAPYDIYEPSGRPMQPPSLEHIMGTDAIGRDVFSRILAGARFSLTIAFIAVGFWLFGGTLIGAISGYVGGNLDRTVSVTMDALWAFPSLILAILISVVLGQTVLYTALAIAVPRVPGYFRVIRSITLSVKERGFIEAEKVLGNTWDAILLRHVAPFYTSTLIVLGSMSVSGAVLAVSGLGFLGLGIPPPLPEWGSTLASGQTWALSGMYWLTVFPGLMIFITILGFSLLSEGLDLIISQREKRL